MILEILICTIDEGINRVSDVLMTPHDEIRYLVSWQQTPSGQELVIPLSLQREDVKITTLMGRGLSRNRNHALSQASGDICLIADDDVRYDFEEVKRLITVFKQEDTLDMATFQYVSTSHQKYYPKFSFDLDQYPRFYYVSSIEIAFRRNRIQGVLQFNELMGLGSPLLPVGEEELFIIKALRLGMHCKFYPIVIVHHDSFTSGYAIEQKSGVIRARGIVIKARYPRYYPLQILISALREQVKNGYPFFKSLKYMNEGVKYAKENHIC